MKPNDKSKFETSAELAPFEVIMRSLPHTRRLRRDKTNEPQKSESVRAFKWESRQEKL